VVRHRNCSHLALAAPSFLRSGKLALGSGARRVLCVTVLALLPSIVSCQTRAGQGSGSVNPTEVPEDLRDEWQALESAKQADRSSEAVDAAADALLEQKPPPALVASALQAKAERQYMLGNDAEAIAFADEALATIDAAESASKPSKEQIELMGTISRVLALALTRGGDPVRALAQLDALAAWDGMDPIELRGARAVALDRKGDTAGALAAFVSWRELLQPDSPDAGYAEERIAALVAHLDRATIESLAAAAPGPDAADCLRATLGIDPGDQAPAWVSACRPLPARIGILLPRTGKLAALADAQLAAAVAAVTVLGRERPVSVMWRDSGSTPDTARAGADRLVADGAEVIIGPVGASNVRAALATVGDDRFVLPGEGTNGAVGIAPTLEQRTVALIDHAIATGAKSVIVLVPDNGYGTRVQKARDLLEPSKSKSLKIVTYPASTTSFAPILQPLYDSLRNGAAIVVGDALPRTEMIVRQIRRDQFRVAGGKVDKEGTEVTVLSTGEGLAPDAIGAKHDSLDGVILAPVASPNAASRAFEDEYFAQQRTRPDDQALLVWRALEAAWSGASSTLDPKPELVRVQGSNLVAIQAP
jgi:ABC-type branched-subunit amino acid transport system substrate-binding protein